MEDFSTPPIPAELCSVAASATACLSSIALPPPFAADRRAGAIEGLLGFLDELDIICLSTLDQAGWPMASVMHFAAARGPGGRPVIYMFTHLNTRKLDNIAANSRVALSALAQLGGEPAAANAPFASLQGVARLVPDDAERELAYQANRNKVGYEFTAMLDLLAEPLLRVDVVNAVWDDGSHEAIGLIDFSKTFSTAT